MLLTANTEGWAPRSEKKSHCSVIYAEQTETSYANYKRAKKPMEALGKLNVSPVQFGNHLCAERKTSLEQRDKISGNRL